MAANRFHILTAGLEDPFAAITHIVAACIFILLTFRYLIHYRHHVKIQIALLMFGCVQIFSFIMSALYHSFYYETAAQKVFLYLDHAGIILCIAGTCSTFLYLIYEGRYKFLFIYGIFFTAILLIILKMLYFYMIPDILYVSVGLGMGLLTFFALGKMHLAHSHYKLYMYLGASFYIFGAVLDTLLNERSVVLIPGVLENHEIFHMYVFLGGISFFTLLLRFIKLKMIASQSNL